MQVEATLVLPLSLRSVSIVWGLVTPFTNEQFSSVTAWKAIWPKHYCLLYLNIVSQHICILECKIASNSVALAGLQLLNSRNPPTSACWVTTGVCHYVWIPWYWRMACNTLRHHEHSAFQLTFEYHAFMDAIISEKPKWCWLNVGTFWKDTKKYSNFGFLSGLVHLYSTYMIV